MRLARSLFASAILLMALGVLNAGPEAIVVEELPAPQVQADETQAQVSVPEPNVMLFAGIG